ncbi:MAG: hypothetical protein ACLFPV_11310 [Spirochaetaceae bacterium]
MAKRYLHQRIQEQLRQRIEEGTFAPGDKIATTNELARELWLEEGEGRTGSSGATGPTMPATST